MKSIKTAISIKPATRRMLASSVTAACLALSTVVAAQQIVPNTTQESAPLSVQDTTPQTSSPRGYHYTSGWSLNLTPVLMLPRGNYRWGGGGDPELKYTADLGQVRLSAGARVGAYYAKNLFGLTAMPTLRVAIPTGDWEPYVAFGMGYGWLPEIKHSDLASMSRVGFVYHLSQSLALGLEGMFQKIDSSDFSFPAVGSMVAFEF